MGVAVQLLRPLPLYAALSTAWAGLMVATVLVLWRLRALSPKALVLSGLGWASLICLVYSEMIQEELEATGQEMGASPYWAYWYFSGVGLAALALAIWGVPHLIRKYRKRG